MINKIQMGEIKLINYKALHDNINWLSTVFEKITKKI